MNVGIIGKKCGMTRIFTEAGESIPVTLIEALSNRVVRIKQAARDGYDALQVTAGERRAALIGKPVAGEYAAAKVAPGIGLWEFPLSAEDAASFAVGAELEIDKLFTPGQRIDVTGTSKGKGFAGPIKRYNFRSQDASHGNSLSHRAPGSIGQNQTPGHVFRGKKMAGHMGAVRRTQQGLELVRIDTERKLLAVRGSVPGAAGGVVIVRPTTKG